ncbi:MAG: trehalose-6-phosphate synthase [Rhizobiales bacterium 65-9]|nr:trehalose-6-phosphate synthase [Hyphomicrobiales bacterium]OJY35694.1 MAG: trehalose-6-phosphate synthase [Rhizobiales bacterium 65-9]
MSRLIIISNRVNPPDDASVGTAGGLAMALAAALREYSGIWFGWSGQKTESFTGQMSMQRVGGVTVALVDLEEQDVQEYYNGYANRTLWPLFHYRMDLAEYERSFDEGYARVNARFAETVLPLIEPDDLIWVQDYHLIPLARELRRRGVANRIGFFLHIPWPARRLITILPRHETLVEAMLDYDLIGFQGADSRDAFGDYIEHVAGGERVASEGPITIVSLNGKQVRIGAFPIGIDAADFTKALESERSRDYFTRMVDSRAGRQMIVGVDRLDYSKGLEDRFLSYELLLSKNPDLLEKVFLLQVATPSRDEVAAYQEIRSKLDMVSGRINGAFATVDWVPIRYVNHVYRRDELSGIYRAAAIGLVTPHRDGMNLVAKEYVAAQDPDDPGVLVLSEFAGAAAQMGEALIVNPFSREEVSDAIRRGLTMPLSERKRRWEILMHGVQEDDVEAWRDSFVKALEATPRSGEAAPSEPRSMAG